MKKTKPRVRGVAYTVLGTDSKGYTVLDFYFRHNQGVEQELPELRRRSNDQRERMQDTLMEFHTAISLKVNDVRYTYHRPTVAAGNYGTLITKTSCTVRFRQGFGITNELSPEFLHNLLQRHQWKVLV
jgi:hypothetical protein